MLKEIEHKLEFVNDAVSLCSEFDDICSELRPIAGACWASGTGVRAVCLDLHLDFTTPSSIGNESSLADVVEYKQKQSCHYHNKSTLTYMYMLSTRTTPAKRHGTTKSTPTILLV